MTPPECLERKGIGRIYHQAGGGVCEDDCRMMFKWRRPTGVVVQRTQGRLLGIRGGLSAFTN